MRHPLDGKIPQKGHNRLYVDPCGSQKNLAKGRLKLRHMGGKREGGIDLENPPDQGKPVTVETTGGQADHHIPVGDVRAIHDLLVLRDANDKSRQVIVSLRVHPRHLRRFSPHKGTSRFPASLGNSLQNLPAGIRIQFSTGKVIQKKEGPGPLDNNVVHAHGHEVNSYRLVTTHPDSNLEFCANSIRGGNQNGMLHAISKDGVKGREIPQAGFYLGRPGFPHNLGNIVDKPLSFFNIHTCFLIGSHILFPLSLRVEEIITQPLC